MTSGTLPISRGGTGVSANSSYDLLNELFLDATEEDGALYFNDNSNLTVGVLPINRGGTNANTAAAARSSLGAQETLVSGTNIKTINNESLLGSGNISISGGGSIDFGAEWDAEALDRAIGSGDYGAMWIDDDEVVKVGGPLPIAYGGTGATNAAQARTNLGISGGGGSVTTWYGTSSTTASTAAKAVTCSNFALETGAIVAVLFTTANTAATPTLNVNSTGAKTIYVGSGTVNSTTNTLKWSANTLLYFVYDGTYFRYLGSQSAASVVPPEGAGTWYGTSSTAATTAAKTSTIANFKLRPGAIVNITFSTANTKADTALTLNINSTGAKTIYVNNAATSSTNVLTWSANETLTFVYSGSYWFFLGRSGISGDVAVCKNQLEAIGEQYSDSATNVSVANSTNTNVVSIAPGEGVWVAVGLVSYPSNSTGRRMVKLSTTPVDSGNPPSSNVIAAVNGAYTHMSTSRCFSLTDEDEIYLVAWQNSGSALSCNGTIEVTRIA